MLNAKTNTSSGLGGKSNIRNAEHRRYIYNELQKAQAKAEAGDLVLYDADEMFVEFDSILEAHGL